MAIEQKRAKARRGTPTLPARSCRSDRKTCRRSGGDTGKTQAAAPAARRTRAVVARAASAGGGEGVGTLWQPPAKRGRVESLATEPKSITEGAVPLSDHMVALELSFALPRSPRALLGIMRRWHLPILKADIPGLFGCLPTQMMLRMAKKSVLDVFAEEQGKGKQSVVFKAFMLASGEKDLHLEWTDACRRVRGATLDMMQSVDLWTECLAMTHGDTNSDCRISVCGTKDLTVEALASLLCHEGLHNTPRRMRRGNPFLSQQTEHIAMALLGDPQLISFD